MFGINKNGLKQKIGVLMPSFFPASRTSYSNSLSGLTATNAQDAIDELAQGGGGHTIQNTSGTDMPAEDNLQFVGVYTEDDSANDRTKVNIVRQMTKAAMEALSSAEQEGLIDTTDEDDDYIPMAAEDVKYGNTDVESVLDSLNTLANSLNGRFQLVPPANKKAEMAYGWYAVLDLSISWATDISLWVQLTSGEHVYAYTQSKALSLHRNVTTLVDETANIAAGGSKLYATLTASALSAYDEVWFYAEFGNVATNGSATKGQIAAAAAYSSGGVVGASINFFSYALETGGSLSITNAFGVGPKSGGLYVYNRSISGTLGKLLIEGITY